MMRFMEEKAAERFPDCLVSSSAVLQLMSANARRRHPSVVVQFCNTVKI